LFELTGLWYWSSTAEGSSVAWYVNRANGYRGASTLSYAINHRALCVRRS
jgi:hypothetical protein